MTDRPITDEQLDEWEKLDKAGTPGPWGYSLMPVEGKLTAKDGRGKRYSLVAADAPFVDPADAELAALARTTFPYLIAEVRRMRAEKAASSAPIGSFWRDTSDPSNPVVKRWNGKSWDAADAETDEDGNILVWNATNDA